MGLSALPARAARRRPRARMGTRLTYGARRGRNMAKEPQAILDTIARFGPHRAYAGGGRLEASARPDRLVQTHCCFCGQQCGIQLKVKDNQVIGFEPWEDFPFNRGMLCPKGVRRYLQGSHPDRLTTALARDPSSPSGFRPMPYD